MRTTSIATLIVTCLSLLLSGCFEAGVGDPAKAKIDPKLVGLWKVEDGEMMLVKVWDDRTYIISQIAPVKSEDGVERLEPTGGCFRAWLANIGGKTFITLDQSMQRLHKIERPFVVAQIRVEGEKLVVQGLDPEFAESAHTPAEMEKHIRDNLKNPKLLVKEVTTYVPVPEAISAMVK
ncbi:hypothetical protein [Humisphaera borealis]|uniref:Lipocalin-like domain-containing protein n=1 Tax=Humisphaera borealis TaxID=2807512 RepID=A0A7M2WZ71_9BACT|nr:hypothetical protein [Humisphaera borealis]QOV90151.1 hypothetical protein IPV69_01895 [Humisphaera borealis]